jgi:hypothetical protein
MGLNYGLGASLVSTADAATAAEEATEGTRHWHNRERWYGKLAVPAGGKVLADNEVSFQIDSGNLVYGSEVLIIDVNDTPIIAGQTHFDFDRIFITDVEQTTAYKVQFAYGTGTFAAAIAAGQYTETLVRVDATNSDRASLAVKFPHIAVGNKVWARCRTAANTGTIDFLIGIHGYTA